MLPPIVTPVYAMISLVFVEICVPSRNGVNKDIAEEVFEQLAAFAAYGFCKAHAVAYALIAYQTLWLKCHYPAEFFAAVLSNQPMGYYPPRVLVAEARRSGSEILPPDVNNSSSGYIVENGAIRVSLKQLKGMSEEALESILSERAKDKFASLRDFVLRTNTNQSIIANLVKVGAFDSLGNRSELFVQLPKLVDLKNRIGERARPLFEDAKPELPVTEDPSYNDKKTRMLVERELLSLDLGAHPLDFLTGGNGFTKMQDLPSVATGKTIKIAGSVIRYQTPPTRNGNRVLYVIMEDGTGIADIVVFGDIQEKCGQVLFREGWLIVKGKVQRRGPKAISIVADDLSVLPEAR